MPISGYRPYRHSRGLEVVVSGAAGDPCSESGGGPEICGVVAVTQADVSDGLHAGWKGALSLRARDSDATVSCENRQASGDDSTGRCRLPNGSGRLRPHARDDRASSAASVSGAAVDALALKREQR
jgi:hypothetical protein